MKDFHSTNTELASFVVSIYILGFAIGPMYVLLNTSVVYSLTCLQDHRTSLRALRPKKALPMLQRPLPRLHNRLWRIS